MTRPVPVCVCHTQSGVFKTVERIELVFTMGALFHLYKKIGVSSKIKEFCPKLSEWDLENFATRSRSCGLRLKSGVKEWGVMDDESGESVEEEVAVAGRGNECVAAE